MTKLLTQNSKMRKSAAKNNIALFNFGIPAYSSERTGIKTCPMAGECGKFCYAQKGAYAWPVVENAYENRLEALLRDDFVEIISKEINTKLKTSKRRDQQLAIRLNDSGDIFNLDYYNKIIELCNKYPTVIFYAYTKSVTMTKRLNKAGKLPSNFTFILSEGGLEDVKINPNVDRHSRIFNTVEELLAAGYDDASNDDTVAFTSKTGKIGLVKH